jgi:hypothetical protein
VREQLAKWGVPAERLPPVVAVPASTDDRLAVTS